MNNQDGKADCQTFFTRHQMTKVWFSECSLMTIYIRTAWSVCVETAYYQAYPQFTVSEYLAVKSRSLQFPKGAHVICIYTKTYILLHLGHEYDHWWKTFSQSSWQKLENTEWSCTHQIIFLVHTATQTQPDVVSTFMEMMGNWKILFTQSPKHST